MKLGAAQFLRDFRRDFNVKKTEAHRKRVIEKSKKKEQESSKVSITSIQEDTSDGRSVSKALLVALLTKIPAVFESRIYSKNELLELSKIYGISCRSSDTKAKISKQLVETIMPVDMPMATVVHSESVQMVGTAHDGDSASNVMSLQSTERALHGKLEGVQFIVDNCDYHPDIADSCGATPLMDALRSGHIAIAEYLITHQKASVQACDKLGHQPIHLAAQTGCISSMDYLVSQHNVDPQTRTDKTAMTPLHFAAKEGHSDVIKYLAGLRVDLNAQDCQKRTALHLAAAAGHAGSVHQLLDIKADASILDTNGKTALDLAIKLSVKELLE